MVVVEMSTVFPVAGHAHGPWTIRIGRERRNPPHRASTCKPTTKPGHDAPGGARPVVQGSLLLHCTPVGLVAIESHLVAPDTVSSSLLLSPSLQEGCLIRLTPSVLCLPYHRHIRSACQHWSSAQKHHSDCSLLLHHLTWESCQKRLPVCTFPLPNMCPPELPVSPMETLQSLQPITVDSYAYPILPENDATLIVIVTTLPSHLSALSHGSPTLIAQEGVAGPWH
ncbi:hypothetical protein IWX90DRAFT_434467 [Phyllosticta citrichinensis]|uniref:Uncharacterized protein n=1 Tax=Phyllosticta citrichinensis TaxID=1130410 RepID=A0ABR1XV55_9PEZI